MPVQHSPPNAKRPRTLPKNEPSDQSNVQEPFITPMNRSRESLLPCDFEMKDKDDLIAIDLKNLHLLNTPTHPKRRPNIMAKSSDKKTEPQTVAAVKDDDRVPSYWEGDKPDLESPYEMAVDQCALRVIEETVPDDISNLIGTIVLAHEAMNIIEDQFHQGGRMAQMATFQDLIFRTFDPATMDCLAGLLYQLGAPTSGEFSMEGVNTALDAQYQNNPRPFTACEAMATKTMFKSPMRSFPSTSAIQSLTPLSENTEERDMSINNPIPIPKSAAAECHNGDEQCYHCGKFKHTKDRCVWSRSRPRTALHWNDWRRVVNGRMYSIDVLGLRPGHLQKSTGGFFKPKAAAVMTPIADGDEIPRVKVSAVKASWNSEGIMGSESADEFTLDGGASDGGKGSYV
ncbi:hypothetical protein CROQUDRAFT_92314 [Cronartium quercuum f. sp. fusiforme G11]|uniref:Uncharacterized protein n=1 Tax=Cronartium quercuum f. sp. fusiforme G11 TaxID=708437 RepID=A0A9P6NGS6_9BASI|nr:hypothetical protein CROQUDRAFT_92314 [Cronartium quercuum f. sp. fusiforme G11]